MPSASLLSTGVLAALISSASATGMCVNLTAAPYAQLSALTTSTTCLDASGDTQWVGAFGQDNPAGGTPRKKTWWTKSKSGEKVHFGGAPTVREVKLLHEQGFDAIYALVSGSADAKAAAVEAGMMYKEGVGSPDTDASIDDVAAFVAFVEANTDGYVYLHCGCGRWSGAAVQFQKAKTGVTTDSAVALNEMNDHGYGMTAAFVTKLKTLTATNGEETVLEEVGTKMCGENNYWKAKYLGKFGSTELYDAGQIYSNEVSDIAGAFASVVNMRKSDAAQETTTLLNVIDNKYAYDGADGSGSWADTWEVKSYLDADCDDDELTTSCFKVDKNRPNTWISGMSTTNVELVNTFEFGNMGGYSQSIESAALTDAGLDYTHLPIGSNYTLDSFLAYSEQMIGAINTATAADKKAVLFHCRTGYRTGAFPSVLIGALAGTSSSGAKCIFGIILAGISVAISRSLFCLLLARAPRLLISNRCSHCSNHHPPGQPGLQPR